MTPPRRPPPTPAARPQTPAWGRKGFGAVLQQVIPLLLASYFLTFPINAFLTPSPKPAELFPSRVPRTWPPHNCLQPQTAGVSPPSLNLPPGKSFSEAASDLVTGAWEGGCFLNYAPGLHNVPAVPVARPRSHGSRRVWLALRRRTGRAAGRRPGTGCRSHGPRRNPLARWRRRGRKGVEPGRPRRGDGFGCAVVAVGAWGCRVFPAPTELVRLGKTQRGPGSLPRLGWCHPWDLAAWAARHPWGRGGSPPCWG